MFRTMLSIGSAALAFTLLGGVSPVPAASGGVKAGYLKCEVEGNVSFIFGSSRDMVCTYTPGSGKRVDHYSGQVKKFGVDIGYQESGVILWGVIAPTSDVGAGALAGDYGGVTGDFAAGYGVGANALVGGSSKSIVLQPLSVEGIKGINIAGGIGLMTLRAH